MLKCLDYIYTIAYLYSIRNEQKTETMNELMKNLPAEIERVKKMTSTLEGLQNVISVFENNFNEEYTHGDNVVYEVARVNVVNRLMNKAPLC